MSEKTEILSEPDNSSTMQDFKMEPTDDGLDICPEALLEC